MMNNLKNKKVLVRVDFNVPLDSDYNITDDSRMVLSLPTLKRIIDEGGIPIIMSHLGRPQKKLLPNGEINRDKFSLRHVVSHLSELLGVNVKFVDDCIGDKVSGIVDKLISGDVLLIENTRFYKEEKKGDVSFAKQLASLGDVYINDAFGTAHRAHASTSIIAQFFSKENKSLGLLMENEIDKLNRVVSSPVHPVTAILGGAKVSDKILLIENLMASVDNIIIGGGMAYTFFKALGGNIGNSLVEEDRIDNALDILKKAKENGTKILLPHDSLCADSFSNDAGIKSLPSDSIDDGWMGLDIGNKALNDFSKTILSSKTILWNGPMGVFEFPNFAGGTNAIADLVAEATKNGAFSVVGGGDSVAAIKAAGMQDAVSHLSSGGGAMLEYLEGKKLPGIIAVSK